MSRLAQGLVEGWTSFLSITSHHISYQTNVSLTKECVFWLLQNSTCWYLVVRPNVTHPEAGVRNVPYGTVGIHSGVVGGGLAVIGLQDKHTHGPGGVLRMNNSATVGDYSGPLLFLPFSCVTDRHAAPRLCGQPCMNTAPRFAYYTIWIPEHYTLVMHSERKKDLGSSVDFSSCKPVDFTEVLRRVFVRWQNG